MVYWGILILYTLYIYLKAFGVTVKITTNKLIAFLINVTVIAFSIVDLQGFSQNDFRYAL